MRLAALGLHHESNTFAPVPADLRQFEVHGLLRGAQIADRYEASHATMGGFLAAAQRPGVEVVPLLFAYAEPMGAITADAFDAIIGELLALLTEQGPFDGVLLALHGAAVAEHCRDVDGEIAARVRRVVGPDVPIGLALDLHANVSRRMVENVTVTVPYQTNPHIDARERAVDCADLLIRTVRREILPVQALATPPLTVNILRQATDDEPLRGLLAAAGDLRRRPGMLWAGVVEGFPYADVAEMGMAFLAIHDGDAAAADAAARELATRAWEARGAFNAAAPKAEEALAAALWAPGGPVVLLDVGDNIGGGSPGDSTVLLAAARRLGVRRYLQTLLDPEAVAACVECGRGGRITLEVGAKTDRRHGDPVTVTGRVRCLSDGRFEEPTATHGGWRFFDAGPTAVLDTDDDMTLVLSTHKVANTSLQQLRSVGVEPERMKVVVAKGVNAPRAAYAPIAAQMIAVDTPGVTSADLSRFEYVHRRRPLYPFEDVPAPA